ncbi:thioredoxin family protein [Desertibaculum subflavum]|uniref:thioredoxin family protein n=1 Tax=Desertibaculum subflavum TaxID=2268458 RepID=UPI000E663968
MSATAGIREGYVVVAKRDCPTCVLVEPVLAELARSTQPLTVFSQDDPTFPATVPGVRDDRALEASFRLRIETVPTLIKLEGGREVGRLVGWQRDEWRALTGLNSLGEGLPDWRPGCGSKSVEPGVIDELEVKYGEVKFAARRVDIDEHEDEAEAMHARGWSDGLPLVPPTPVRVHRMLKGTKRDPAEVIGNVPPDLAPVTVEKIAVNAVMAGCKPEYLPVVIAAVEAALMEPFAMHGVLATTMFCGPIVIVNGPKARAIGMNARGNALGQGNRANATIGRALQLVIRNVGGGRPQEVDRSALGHPGKYTFCFAEDEEGSCWEPLSVERGFAPGASTVTLFAGDGVHGVVDQQSRTPESLARSFALTLRSVNHWKLAQSGDAILVVSPEHERTFREAGWNKARLRQELDRLLMLPAEEMVRGAGGIAEGIPATALADKKRIPKFRQGGLLIVRAGGSAGMFSAVIAGWGASGAMGSSPVTREITE